MIWNFNTQLDHTREETKGRNYSSEWLIQKCFSSQLFESFLIDWARFPIIFVAVPINRNQVCYPPLFRVWNFVSATFARR